MTRAHRISREALALPNRRGEQLAVVTTRPTGAAPGGQRVFVFCQAGLQSKSGVGDYFRWLGDELTTHGDVVVRFDQAGTGDSQGEIEEGIPLNQYFRLVQSGVSVEDHLDLLEWVHERLAPREIVVFGQCGGCISGLLASARRPEQISGLVLLALPVLLTPVEQTVREHDAQVAWRGYLDKLLRPESYLRLLRGESDLRLIRAALLSAPRRLASRLERHADHLLGRSRPDHPLFNPQFWDAFQAAMRREQRILFLMAELDNETPDFDNEFKHKVLQQRPAWAARCTTVYLEEADHSLMFEPARRASSEAIRDWLARG